MVCIFVNQIDGCGNVTKGRMKFWLALAGLLVLRLMAIRWSRAIQIAKHCGKEKVNEWLAWLPEGRDPFSTSFAQFGLSLDS